MAVRRWAVEPGLLRFLVRPLSALAYLLVIRPMLDQAGLVRMRCALSGGAPLSPDLLRLWRLWGLTIRQLYGLTECGGLATIQTGHDFAVGVAGRPLLGTELRLGPDGEVLIRGDGVFGGYLHRPDATAEALEGEGWLHTGDIGILHGDGNLEVVDRKRDVLVMKSGRQVPASSVEHVLKYSPYVRDALLIGDGRPFLAALIEVDFDNLAQWARRNGVAYTGFTSLATSPAVAQLLDGEMARANETLHQRGSEPVARIVALPKELDPEDPTEITATRKIRRRELAAKFSDLVDDLYRTEDSERITRHSRGSH
jgi:long-chain acyl-CoA synthetase